MNLNTPQPSPMKGRVSIVPLVIADLKQRSEMGRRKYGTELMSFNGRDALIDAYQEALDLALYLRQAIEERRSNEVEINHRGGEGEMILGKDIALPKGVNIGDVSDGYHTVDELYEFRKLYNALLFNEWAEAGKYDVYKSKRHSNGEECFGGGWFIVVAMLPVGQISNHYEMKDWNLFQIPEREKAMEFDGHTSTDVLDRLKVMAMQPTTITKAEYHTEEAKRFRKKPIIIEAEQWFRHSDMPEIVRPYHGRYGVCKLCGKPLEDHGEIETLEGVHVVCPGDWIITGVNGEKYPCKPDIFEKTYEPA